MNIFYYYSIVKHDYHTAQLASIICWEEMNAIVDPCQENDEGYVTIECR